jgi:hypothetical protein
MRFRALLIVGFFLLFGCNKKKVTENELEFYFNDLQKKEMVAKIISYIYVTPFGVKDEDRFLPENREFYLNESSKFKVVRFFKDEQNQFYFYLVRPATNPNNLKRGVGGVFTLDKVTSEIDNFKEVFVTKMMQEDDVIHFGNITFEDFVKNKGSFEMTPVRKDLIEFPSFMSEYDSIKKMWVYKEPVSLD